MAESVLLKTEQREGRGSRQAERLRKQGKVPAVVYGHKEETLSVSVGHDDLVSAIRHGARVVDIDVAGKTEKAQIVEVQWDYLGKDVLHVDFKRVSAHEKIEAVVSIELRGTAPGIADGGILDQPLHILRVECPASAVLEVIKVNISELKVGEAIHVRDLKLPEGVSALDKPDAIVVHITQPKVTAEPGAAPLIGGQAEPEVITRKKTDEEEEK
jgi:large subunit ribosomal protein L25